MICTNDMTLTHAPDELILPEVSTTGSYGEYGRLVMVDVNDLQYSKYNPFNVSDDSEMERLKESILENGVVVPVIAFCNESNELELVAGNRRKHACELLGISSIPVVIKNITRDQANILIGLTNLLTREVISPSEKGKAYRLIRDARAHQGKKVVNEGDSDLTSESLSEMTGESYDTIFRFIRLTYLIKDLQDFVDDNKLSLKAAVELSYISSPKLQKIIADIITENKVKISVKQAKLLRNLDKNSELDESEIITVLDSSKAEDKKESKEKVNVKPEVFLSKDFCYKYFPDCNTSEELERAIEELIDLVNEYQSRLLKEVDHE